MEWISSGKRKRGRSRTTWEMGVRKAISEKNLAEQQIRMTIKDRTTAQHVLTRNYIYNAIIHNNLTSIDTRESFAEIHDSRKLGDSPFSSISGICHFNKCNV